MTSLGKRICSAVVAAGVAAAFSGSATLAAGRTPAVTDNPFAPAYGHPYRHGAVPTLAAASQMAAYRAAHPAVPAASPSNLNYGGGVDGIGVTTGSPRVYLVFWGSQWGTAGTDASGDVTLSGDPSGMAPRLQQFFKGVGVNELWSGVMTQYCEGIAAGLQTCPITASHVGYPTSGALAGVWADTASAAPAQATQHQLGMQAITAASHFGNTNAAANRNSQYVVVSPHGTHPDGFLTPGSNFCAWHDWNGDPTLTGGGIPSPVGDIAFTNLPYVVDAGGSCGENFVNAGAAGVLDGATIVEGHEYAETITDQNPAGGWTDSTGAENGDKCAWIKSGPARIQNVTFGAGQFTVQSTWANDLGSGGGCEISHPIVGGSGGGLAMAVSPAQAAVTAGQAATVSATVFTSAATGFTETVALSATGLPAGVTASFSPASVTAGGSAALTLHEDGTTPVGSYLLTVKGTAPSATQLASFTLAIVQRTGAIVNGGFEFGLTGWTATGVTSTVNDPVHGGLSAALIGTTDVPRSTSPTTSTLVQSFTVPAGQSHLTLYYQMICTDILQFDWFTVTLRDNTARHTTTPVPRRCVTDSGWQTVTVSVRAGHRYTLTLLDRDDGNAGDPSYTFVDDVATS